jgi:hypothetical protein
VPSRRMRGVLWLVLCAPAVGALISIAWGTSVWTATAFAIVLSGGMWLFTWWLAGKTGVRRDMQRMLPGGRANRRDKDR